MAALAASSEIPQILLELLNHHRNSAIAQVPHLMRLIPLADPACVCLAQLLAERPLGPTNSVPSVLKARLRRSLAPVAYLTLLPLRILKPSFSLSNFAIGVCYINNCTWRRRLEFGPVMLLRASIIPFSDNLANAMPLRS